MTDTNEDETAESSETTTDGGRASRRAWLQSIGLLGLVGVTSRSASAGTGHFGEDWSGSASSDAGLEVHNTYSSGSAIGLKGWTDSSSGYGVRSRGPLSVASISGGTTNFEVEESGTVQFSTPVNNGKHEPMLRMFAGGTSNATQPVVIHSSNYPGWGLFYEDTGDNFVFRSSSNDTMFVRLWSDPTLEVVGDAKIDGRMETTGSWQVDVDGDRALELGSQSSGDAGRVVAGHASNQVKAGAVGATVSGGGYDDGSAVNPNVVTDDYGTVGGGEDNQAGSDDGDSTTATHATVGGGEGNLATGDSATVGGGTTNEAEDALTTVAGGGGNSVHGDAATIGGGEENEVGGPGSTLCGGFGNVIDADLGFVGGGRDNVVGYTGGTIAGGVNNGAQGMASFVAAGGTNDAWGDFSFAGGRYAFAENDNTFVWCDGTASASNQFSSSDPANGSGVTGPGTFHVKSSEGVRMLTGAGTTFIPGGSTGWSVTSTRAAKTNVDPVEPQQVLDGVQSLEVSTWEYEGEDGDGAGVQHVGPMAEEFHREFDLGSSDEHINSVNADGIALAAIQGLADRLDDREERIDELEAENEELRDRLATLEEHVGVGAGDDSAAGEPQPADD
jgi:hypothetical protein